MKRKLKRIFVLLVLLPTLLLSSCIKPPVSGSNSPGAVPSPSESAEAAAPSPAPTDWHSGVKTDYSGLTPYKPPEEKYTRLKNGAMPDLVPSGYGKLLPYIGETMYNEKGYSVIRRFGLVTQAGMLVTDPVYTRVYQGSYYDYGAYSGEYVPAYSLEKLSGKIDKEKPWESEIYAVCASDGSWVTKFEYTSVFYTEKVIILVRSQQNDIDIMDYSGKLLFNTKSLSCYSDIPESSANNFLNGYGEGLIALPLSSGRTVFIDALTGKETYTDYTQCSSFSDGLAAVMQNGLYGFIDKSFNLVIPPQYTWVDHFSNDKCVVQYPDQSHAIIDASGNILLKNQYYVSRWDNSFYGVYDASNNAAYYDTELNKLTDGSKLITPIGGEWFFYTENKDVTILKGSEKHTFHNISGVSYISGNLAAVSVNNSSSWQQGLLTLDGKVVIPMTQDMSIAVVTSEKTGKTYAIASNYGSDQTYKVYNPDGEILFSGNGYASYMTENDLFEISDERSFAYVDTAGRDVFRISLIKYVPD